jgi:uridine kinase
MTDLTSAIELILAKRRAVPRSRAILVAISGIDGSGKGWVTARLVDALQSEGVRAIAVNVDGWLSLPHERFDAVDPPGRFYRRAIRFDEMFARLVVPLRDRRSVRVEADFTEETATAYRPHVYAHDDVDVIVLEGIFLLKRALRSHYDLSFWIACSFATALRRAIARAQEGLPPEETIAAYQRIYFPAQEIHLALDDPVSAATAIIDNDELPPARRATGAAGALIPSAAASRSAR